jgi:NAD(P)-dependent dehydrogenase (short-subunit alcohol dehydrogenase family)
MGQRLQGRTAFVTGAAQGIGAGIARAMAAQGAQLILSDLNEAGVAALAAELGARAIGHDVASEVEWNRAAELVEGAFGHLDVLVNNAGIEVVKPASETSLDDWRRVMSVNLDGVFVGCRTMQPLLNLAGARGASASVINISSIAGLVGYPNQAAYNTSKAGVRHLTKSLAIEWAHHGHPIRVNSIHPGCIRTPMLELAVKGWIAEGSIPADADPWEAIAALCPMRRVGRVEDIAHGAVYLASDESAFVTGLELVIDGGWVAR